MDLDMIEGFYALEMAPIDTSKYCPDLGYIGGSLFSRTDVSFPVNAEIEPEISFMIQHHIDKFKEFVAEWETTNPIPVECQGSLIEKAQPDPKLTEISPKMVVFELLMLLAACVLAYIFAWFVPSRVPERPKHL